MMIIIILTLETVSGGDELKEWRRGRLLPPGEVVDKLGVLTRLSSRTPSRGLINNIFYNIYSLCCTF